jgi:hypothetical protein
LTKVIRTVIADGDYFAVECAVRSDLSSPVVDFLADVARGGWHESRELEPDEQVDWHHWFIAACELLANTGHLPHRDAHNQLLDGIWEIKHGSLRVSFYDTDGRGNHTPKINRDGYSRFTTRPWPEDFDEYLRLTTAFPKTGRRTPPSEIVSAQQVREEDLEHDRQG